MSDSRKHAHVSFEFLGQSERLSFNRTYISEFETDQPGSYKIVIYAREGAWNHYMVEDWEIVRR